MSLLRYIGCTGHAHEVAVLRRRDRHPRPDAVHDAANPPEVIRDVIAFATAGRSEEDRAEILTLIQSSAPQWATHNFKSGCEVAEMLLHRLDFGPAVRESLAFTFERWNGNGYPTHAQGESIPLPMRIVHLSHDMEALGRLFSADRALERCAIDATAPTIPRWPISSSPTAARAGAAADHRALGCGAGARTGAASDAGGRDPRHRAAGGGRLHRHEVAVHERSQPALRATGGRCRACAGLSRRDHHGVRHAALVHDFGTTAVPNSIWDKPSALTRQSSIVSNCTRC